MAELYEISIRSKTCCKAFDKNKVLPEDVEKLKNVLPWIFASSFKPLPKTANPDLENWQRYFNLQNRQERLEDTTDETPTKLLLTKYGKCLEILFDILRHQQRDRCTEGMFQKRKSLLMNNLENLMPYQKSRTIQ